MSLRLVWLGVCFASLAATDGLFCQDQSGGAPLTPKKFGGNISQIILGLNMESGERIHYVEVPYILSESLTVREKIAELDAKAKTKAIDRKEELLLAELKRIQEGAGSSGQDLYLSRRSKSLSISIPSTSGFEFESVLKMLVDGDPEFSYLKSNTSFVVYPKQQVLEKLPKVTLKLNNIDVGTPEGFKVLVDAIEDSICKKLGVSFILDAGMMMGILQGGPKNITLDLEDVMAYDALSRVSDVLGPNVTWSIRGPAGYQKLQFSGIKY